MSNQYRALASLALRNALTCYRPWRDPVLGPLFRASLINTRYFRARIVLPVQALPLP